MRIFYQKVDSQQSGGRHNKETANDKQRMTRIALIAGTYAPNRCGVAHYTDRLRSALVNQKIETTVLTTFNAADGADIEGVVEDWNISNLWRLVQAVHRAKADILHIQHAAGTYGFDRAIFLLPLLLRLSGWQSPIVTTIHEYGWWEWQPAIVPAKLMEGLKTWGQQRGWWDREDGFLLTQSDAIITTNGDAERVICERLPQLKHRLRRIPIGANVEVAEVDRSSTRRQLLQDCGWAENAEVIVFFGFLHPVKGLETLLPAFKHALTDQPNARLLLIGGVESLALQGEAAHHYWEKLQKTVAELGLMNQVHLTGYLDAQTASRYLAAADIGVLPFNHGVTLKSGSLLALMAHGLPVIATRATPVDSDLENQGLIRSITPRNSDELATALIELLTHVSLRHQLGSSGKAFSRQFAWSSIAEAHVSVYQSVLENRVFSLSRSVA